MSYDSAGQEAAAVSASGPEADSPQELARELDSGADPQPALDEAVRFDKLVGEVVADFLNLPAERVDDAIDNALRRAAEALRLDRCAVFHIAEGGEDFSLTHQWVREGFPPAPPVYNPEDQFPWSLAKLLRGETVAFSSPDAVPDQRERESLRLYQTRARVVFPLTINGRIRGAISFAFGRDHHWSRPMLERLQLVAQAFGSVLGRTEADAALRESELRFRTLADNTPAMIWMSGLDSQCTWLNRQWLEFVGQPLELQLGSGWTAHVHPDDLKSCLETYSTSFEARRPFSIEYRVLRHDGEWRWVLDNGTPNSAGGEFVGYVGTCMDVTEQKRAVQELERLRDDLHTENVNLRREVRDRLGTPSIVGESEAIRTVMAQVEQVATTDSTVLLLGETGTGKELFATRIHELSARRGRTMVRVNCGAIPPTLIESELFGREKGAFTGALARQAGRFELADRSSIFLDEIGDLPADVQVKLLRVLEERQIERLGSPRPIRIDTRIIAATHRNLELKVAQGSFREDLFYRLNVFPIHIPPLRERVEDIPLLVWRFVVEFSRALGKRIDTIPRENMTALQQYSWPGNIRELRNVVERSMILARGPALTIAVPATGQSPGAATSHSLKLTDVEKQHIRDVLETSGWRIRGPGGAAERLGLRPTTLETRMAKLGLTRPKH